jgi:hypothetical protein
VRCGRAERHPDRATALLPHQQQRRRTVILHRIAVDVGVIIVIEYIHLKQ